jgi:RNA polymerase sigma-70 factor (ECF subfamily)
VTVSNNQPHFEPTRWSLVIRARGEDESARQVALETLCKAYWYPLYAFLRRSGREVEDAQDLTQDFFARLMDGSLLTAADPAKGKFRTLLLTSLQHLDADAWRAMRRQKRGGEVQLIPLDTVMAEERWLEDASYATSPEMAFDRVWAMQVMQRAGLRIRAEYRGTAELFEALLPRLTGGEVDRMAEVGLHLGMTEAAVKMALSRLRRSYGDILRAEILETVGSHADIQQELRYLLATFSQG